MQSESPSPKTIIYVYGNKETLRLEPTFAPSALFPTATQRIVARQDKLGSFEDSMALGNRFDRRNKFASGQDQMADADQSIEDTSVDQTSGPETKDMPPDFLPLMLTSLKHIRVASLAIGASHIVFRSDHGQLFAYGAGLSGQLGLGAHRVLAVTPELVRFDDNPDIKDVSCGQQHTVALTTTGIVYIWGESLWIKDTTNYCQFVPYRMDPSTYFSGSTISVIKASHAQTMAYSQDSRRLFIWGQTFCNLFFPKPVMFEDCFEGGIIRQIEIAKHAAYALSDEGILHVWGDGTYGELGFASSDAQKTPINLFQPKPVDSKRFKWLVLSLIDDLGDFLPKIQTVKAGERHLLLLTTTGVVYAMGENFHGQCGQPFQIFRIQIPKAVDLRDAGAGRMTVIAIAAGKRHSGLINDHHQLLLWGDASYHKLIHTTHSAHMFRRYMSSARFQVGAPEIAGSNQAFTKPKLVCSLLHRRVVCVDLGDDLTVVVTENAPRCE